MTEEKQDLAGRLRMARELAGLSQGQAAKLMQLHRPSVSEIEAGRRSVKSDELKLFSELYGVEVSWLINGEPEEGKLNREILAAARELSSMKEEDLETLITTIKMIKSKRNDVG